MSPSQIAQHLRREPFRPLRFHNSDGPHYDVYHPEMALVTRSEIAISLASAGNDLPDSMVYCDPVHITRIEPMDARKGRKSAKRRNA